MICNKPTTADECELASSREEAFRFPPALYTEYNIPYVRFAAEIEYSESRCHKDGAEDEILHLAERIQEVFVFAKRTIAAGLPPPCGGINLHRQSRKRRVQDEKVTARAVPVELFIYGLNGFTFHDNLKPKRPNFHFCGDNA